MPISSNHDNLPVLAQLFNIREGEKTRLTAFVNLCDLQLALLTRGKLGSFIASANDTIVHPVLKTHRRIDTIGAGDAFTAVSVVRLLAGDRLPATSDKANRLAAKICSYRGAVPLMKASWILTVCLQHKFGAILKGLEIFRPDSVGRLWIRPFP